MPYVYSFWQIFQALCLFPALRLFRNLAYVSWITLFLIELGTSGDTGSAAISAVRGLPMIDIIVLLPGGRCTKIQQLQMTTVHDANIHNFVGKY